MGTTIRSRYQKFGYRNLITVEGVVFEIFTRLDTP